MVSPKEIRERFTHGRARVPEVAVKKPIGRSGVLAPTTRPATKKPQEAPPLPAASVEPTRTIKIAGLSVSLPPPTEPPIILSKAQPKARIKTTGLRQSRLIVKLLNRTVPARLTKKRAILEAIPVNDRYRLDGWGVTSDGETVLPKRTAEVRLELRDLTAEVEVIVEERPAGSRKKYAPKRWIQRRLERPRPDKWRRPRAAI